MEATKSQLNTWRRKGKKLLYSMLPARIAIKIENGVQPNTICEIFENVTILFVNTTDFNTILSNAEPIEIIKFINSIISVYDKIVDSFEGVNKVVIYFN